MLSRVGHFWTDGANTFSYLLRIFYHYKRPKRVRSRRKPSLLMYLERGLTYQKGAMSLLLRSIIARTDDRQNRKRPNVSNTLLQKKKGFCRIFAGNVRSWAARTNMPLASPTSDLLSRQRTQSNLQARIGREPSKNAIPTLKQKESGR